MPSGPRLAIVEALPGYIPAWRAMRLALYPLEPADTIESEIDGFVRTGTIDGREHGVFVAVLNEEALGFAEVSDAGQGACHVESWYVRPEARRTGVGRALIGACEDCARSRGATLLTSDTNADYPDSPPAHRACGFRASADGTFFERPLVDQS